MLLSWQILFLKEDIEHAAEFPVAEEERVL